MPRRSVLADPKIKQWTYGGKGVGSQGDGTAQFVARSEDAVAALVDYLANDYGMTAYSIAILKT